MRLLVNSIVCAIGAEVVTKVNPVEARLRTKVITEVLKAELLEKKLLRMLVLTASAA